MGVMQAAEQVARESYGKLVAFLAARTRDVAGAEDALSEAFAAALAEWPVSGVPRTPEAWLLTVARRRMVDAVRRNVVADAAEPTLQLLADESAPDPADIAGCAAGLGGSAGDIPDDRLRLMFACAHPALEAGVRAPLMLQTVLGFDAARIASAFLAAPSAMSQRLVRAKARIRQAGIPFRVPGRDELPERLDAVLQAVYAIYSEGWADPAGTSAATRGLAEEALWLGRLLAAMLPDEPEVLGLLSLMLHAEARRDARRDGQGEFVPLDAQDPSRWDGAAIDEAEALLLRASTHGRAGRFQLEAAVQSVHAARRLTGSTDWPSVVQLYDALLALTGSVVVAINRAVAAARTAPTQALAELDKLARDARVAEYQPYWAARAALLAQAGRMEEAAHAYEQAIGLEADPALRRHLQRQAAALGRP
jgi:RNA polymerase sigma-70 factor (ECF subfamily)